MKPLMKNLLRILVNTAVTTSCTIAPQEDPNRQGQTQDFPLYGDVDSVAITRYCYSDLLAMLTYHFNKNGDVTKERGKDFDFPMIWEIKYIYDSEGNKIEQTDDNSFSLGWAWK